MSVLMRFEVGGAVKCGGFGTLSRCKSTGCGFCVIYCSTL